MSDTTYPVTHTCAVCDEPIRNDLDAFEVLDTDDAVCARCVDHETEDLRRCPYCSRLALTETTEREKWVQCSDGLACAKCAEEPLE